MKEYHIAWNEGRSEGFITEERQEAQKAAGLRPIGGMIATVGDAFRESYEDQDCTVQTVNIGNTEGT